MQLSDPFPHLPRCLFTLPFQAPGAVIIYPEASRLWMQLDPTSLCPKKWLVPQPQALSCSFSVKEHCPVAVLKLIVYLA